MELVSIFLISNLVLYLILYISKRFMLNFIYKFLRFLSILCIFIGFAILIYFACHIVYYHNNWSEMRTGIFMAVIVVFFMNMIWPAIIVIDWQNNPKHFSGYYQLFLNIFLIVTVFLMGDNVGY